MERIKNFFSDESGASAVEYGLLVAVLAVGLIASMNTLKNAISAAFGRASTTLGTAGS
jgi:pilus assembly protein Flp/PilA